MELFQPTNEWKWKVVDRNGKSVEKKLSARDLGMGTHFTKSKYCDW